MLPIFILVGAPAVGKSTTSRALASHFSKSIHLAVDDIRHMVVSGLQFPSADWNAELAQQVHLARTSVQQMTQNYRQAEYAVVIDDFWDANLNSDYQALFAQGKVHKVILYPNQTEAHARNFKRSGDSPARAYIDAGIEDVYRQLNPILAQLQVEGWLLLDTTTLSIDATVQAILDKIEERT